jgi:two-component sensor histidine kinase
MPIQASRAGGTFKDRFRARFNDRLAALSRVQGLLSRSDQEPITLRALIETELSALAAAALQEQRIRLDGPAVRLRKTTVQTFALALHELATNALKYGALGAPDGRLSVTWRICRADPADRRLRVEWVEEGFPARAETPDARGGYGRQLIERALPYALKARTRYDLRETTLRCGIDLPLPEGDAAGDDPDPPSMTPLP